MMVDFETELRCATVWVEADMGAPEHDVGIPVWYPNGITVFFVYRPDEVLELTESEHELLAERCAELASDRAESWGEDWV